MKKKKRTETQKERKNYKLSQEVNKKITKEEINEFT